MPRITADTAYEADSDVGELVSVLRDIAMGADMMLQPIALLSANKPLVRYAQEVKRVAEAAIARARS